MTTQTAATAVRTSVVVDAPIERARRAAGPVGCGGSPTQHARRRVGAMPVTSAMRYST